MDSIEEKALKLFKSGLNCSQSVLAAYADTLNFDSRMALDVSRGFGGGMGRMQETCGAVTGSYMVLSIYNSNKHPNNSVKKIMTYSMIQEFSQQFKVLHQTTSCKELLNADLATEEGLQKFKDQHLSENVCQHCITNAIKIINGLIG